MEPTKEILDLLSKRRRAAERTNNYDLAVQEWCERHQVDIDDILSDYGCMLTTEPSTYERLFIERIMNT